MNDQYMYTQEILLAVHCDAQADHDQQILDREEEPESYREHVEIRRNWARQLADNARERADYYK